MSGKLPADGGMGLLFFNNWFLNIINIFIHPWWSPVAAGAIPPTSPAPCKVQIPLNAFWTQSDRLPPEGMSAEEIKHFHLHRGLQVMISQTQMKTISRSMFEDWNQLIIISSDNLPAAHALNDNHTNVRPSVKTCGMAPICTVNTQTFFLSVHLHQTSIIVILLQKLRNASHYSLFLFLFVFWINPVEGLGLLQQHTVFMLFTAGYFLFSLSLSRSSLFFFCDLEQSALQLFKELSNPGLDGSRAWRHNRILALTLMTAPPAVAEPAVGSQEEYIVGGGGCLWEGGGCQGEIDRESFCDALSPMWNNRGGGSEEVLYFWTTTSLTLPTKPHLIFFFQILQFLKNFLFCVPAPPFSSTCHTRSATSKHRFFVLFWGCCFFLAERRWRRWALYGWIRDFFGLEKRGGFSEGGLVKLHLGPGGGVGGGGGGWRWLWMKCGGGWRTSASRTDCSSCLCWPWSSAACWASSSEASSSRSRSVG